MHHAEPQQDAPDEPDAAEEHGFDVPLSLSLLPEHVEADFWASAQMQAGSRQSDWWACCLLLVCDALYFRWHFSVPRSFLFWQRISHCMLQLSSTLVQLGFVVACGTAYARWRPTALAVNRALRMAVIVGMAATCRAAQAAHPTGISLLTGEPIPPFSTQPPFLLAIRHIVFTSGSGLASITMLLPLPWKQQLATQLLLLVPLVCLQLPAARAMASHIAMPSQLQQLCEAVGVALDLLTTAVLGSSIASSAPERSMHCAAHAPGILLLFADLYVGLFLPVYCTYRMERQHKRAYLRQLRQALRAGRRRGALAEEDLYCCTAVFETLVLVLVAGQVWVLATLGGGLLPLIEVPL